MTGTVCYLERSGPDGAFTRVRLVGPELDRSWTAPTSEAGLGIGAGSPSQSLRSAAAWVAEELGRLRELAAVCIDPAGGACTWLSTPSASPEIVVAALQQSQSAGMIPGVAESPTSNGFSLLGDGPLGPGSDRTIEALAPVDASNGSSLRSRLGKSGSNQLGREKRRLAVLSIPDAAARVFIDALDALKIEVHSVLSLWHATAASWDPGRPDSPSSAAHHAASTRDHSAPVDVAESAPPPTAVVLIESSGRVVWSWSVGGELVAAGSMRARVLPHGLKPPTLGEDGMPLPAGPLPGDSSITSLAREGEPPMARRVGQNAVIDAAPQPLILCGEPELGRLLMDWLAWSAQLGLSPERIICLGPQTTPGRDMSLAATLSESLSHGWPGASVDVAVVDDPIGATLNRLRGFSRLGAGSASPTGSNSTSTAPTRDPRARLVSLSVRPGRATRSIYRWAAVATLVGAVCVFFVARRLESASTTAAEQIDQIKAARTELLKTVDPLLPGISARTGAFDEIQNKLFLAREERGKLKREHPMLPELVRLLRNMNGFDKLQIQQVEISNLRGYMTVTLPVDDPEDRDIPAKFYQKLQDDPAIEMRWGSGDFEGPKINTPPIDGVPQPDRRKHYFPGTWLEKPAAPTGSAPTSVVAPGGKS